MEAQRLLLTCVWANLHHHLVRCDGLSAGVACRTVARTSPHSRGAVARQTTVLELLPDEDTKGFRLHEWPEIMPKNTLDHQAQRHGAPTHEDQRSGGRKIARMAKPRPEKKRQKAKPVQPSLPGMPPPEPPGTTRVLPMQLQIGDRMTDSTGEWEVVGRPYTTVGIPREGEREASLNRIGAIISSCPGVPSATSVDRKSRSLDRCTGNSPCSRRVI
jgi:hypothetical protein